MNQPAGLTKEKLEELYRDKKLSLDKIALKTGIGRTRIYNALKRLGIKRRREFKKHIKIRKEELVELYCKQKKSLNEIGKIFDCDGSNIIYWVKKFGIERRPAYRKKIDIPKEVLKELYWNQGLKPKKIAQMFGIKNGRTIIKKMKKYDIPRKSLSEANTIKFKAPFSGDLAEKAFLLGLRTGDFYAKRKDYTIRIQTTSTHPAQVNLLKNSIQKYGETKTYLSKNHAREDEWYIYGDLDTSFDFLVNKPREIPFWIIKNENLFYNFLCAYSDCEGSFSVIKSHEDSVRFIFRISTGDKKVLEQTKTNLELLGYNPRFYLKSKKGKIIKINGHLTQFNLDIYELVLYRKKEVLHIINELLPLSKHNEKIDKMKYIRENKEKNWNEIIPGWNIIREEIKAGLLKNTLQN